MRSVLISDPTLRDGNHAVRHQLSLGQIAAYASAADRAGVPIVEVGHGNGIGASSLQVGESPVSDRQMLETARKNLSRSKLGIHCMPGFATVKKDLKPAIDSGVDVVRVASHCTEADITQTHIAYVRERGKEVYTNLMMSHMVAKEALIEECLKMQRYGSQGVILMDSAGAYLPNDVTERISALVSALKIPVGFHGHNNLGMAVMNSIAAAEAGAKILDGSARGFGAGAGNAQLEVLVAVLEKMGYATGIDFYKMLDAADLAEEKLMVTLPKISSVSIVSGLAGVFSGFSKHVERISKQYGVDSRDVFLELGRRKVVAGQEDLIIEVAMNLAEKKC
ncbi:MAG: 4-hydroxy-2-oxovalerate aldolase [Candidatus Omnitrophica bacterium]|nr:4-hydroxy-2-oxovalerate aldolase [Candidatus Omnitrophota bacterium]